MGVQDLAIEVIKQANEDLLLSETLYELENNYKFFKSEIFTFWCDIAAIGETTKNIIKKNVYKKYRVLKRVVGLNNGKGELFKIKKGNIVIQGCRKRALLLLEKEGDILMYMNVVDSRTLEIRF